MRESDNDPKGAVRDAVLVLRATLTAGISLDEAVAGDCARMSHTAETDGHWGFAKALRTLGRVRRIRILETKGKIAVLEATYGDLLGGDRGQNEP